MFYKKKGSGFSEKDTEYAPKQVKLVPRSIYQFFCKLKSLKCASGLFFSKFHQLVNVVEDADTPMLEFLIVKKRTNEKQIVM